MPINRSSKRFLLKKIIRCKSGDEIIGQIIDISSGGFQILSPTAGKMHQTQSVEFDFCEPLAHITAQVECTWKRYDPDLKLFYCGFRFLPALGEAELLASIEGLSQKKPFTPPEIKGFQSS